MRIGGGWEPFKDFLIRHKYKHQSSDMRLAANVEADVDEFVDTVATKKGVYQGSVPGVSAMTVNTHAAHDDNNGFGDYR